MGALPLPSFSPACVAVWVGGKRSSYWADVRNAETIKIYATVNEERISGEREVSVFQALEFRNKSANRYGL